MLRHIHELLQTGVKREKESSTPKPALEVRMKRMDDLDHDVAVASMSHSGKLHQLSAESLDIAVEL